MHRQEVVKLKKGLFSKDFVQLHVDVNPQLHEIRCMLVHHARYSLFEVLQLTGWQVFHFLI
ncbi:unnamed protein product [Schistosoma mattheei]|uniref:Uncharacterized protein n=1 Tax=Schistosoma mattheei TaxID=31246 RepID=A0A183PKE5_9TREM|nr:unnamed protein product [Schistosoma mattheei]